ncbi:hypothetical protein GQ44DRAFT_657338 [Phaeosphaeriaceae sp. PMI808]|nr:hypothetical protein GQ44DRAFT_657338 [Phaeosphaeriaceae sp. PMI808]
MDFINFHTASTRPLSLIKRRLDSTIIHFDYDCFYASVFEHESPHLKTLPLAIQQKQIVVTCNYEARRRGLHKLQLITEAKRLCPDLVIILGEDLTPFRNVSKLLYAFLASFSWNARSERLGFDEVFMDVSDIVDYNTSILNVNNLPNSFFCLSKSDPTAGFVFDASQWPGHNYPDTSKASLVDTTSLDSLTLRLLLASHLAQHMRNQLESEKGYTATAGISTNKLLAKLVGTRHKPNGQTTLVPPYTSSDGSSSDNVTAFIDELEIGKIPGIGFKIAQKLRAHVLQRLADFDAGFGYGGTKENVHVRDVRQFPDMGPEILERLLGGTGAPHGIGARIWQLINGCDDTDVKQSREIPTQISIEDSYIRLDTLDKVTKELQMLATSLLKRMYADLLEDDEAEKDELSNANTAAYLKPSQRWLAHPRAIRLSTRPRPPQNPDGSRNRSFARISKSTPMPGFVFNLQDNIESIAERLTIELLLPLFHKLHPEKSGWNLSLVNIAATNMANAASEKGGVGRDISKMFRRQDDVLKQWKIIETEDVVQSEAKASHTIPVITRMQVRKDGSEDIPTSSQQVNDTAAHQWISEDEDMLDLDTFLCNRCGALMPMFAMGAHERWHESQPSLP